MTGSQSITRNTDVSNFQNPDTNWMSEGKYGLNGPIPSVWGPSGGKTYDCIVKEFDIDSAVKIAEQIGAKWFQISLGSPYAYYICPNERFNELCSTKPGERCSTRDTVADFYHALKQKDIKLAVYINADGPFLDYELSLKFDWDGSANDQFKEKYFSVLRWWSDKYRDMISAWWVDGCYPWLGFNNDNLNELAAACKHGNPDAIVSLNKDWGFPGCFERCADLQDYTAGEMTVESSGKVGSFAHTCKSRWINGMQWVHYLPLGWQYAADRCAYTDKEIVDYMKNCFINGGAVLLNYSGECRPLDPAQLEQLQNIKRAIRDGIDPQISFDAYSKIEADYCNSMTTTLNLRYDEKLGKRVVSKTSRSGSVEFESVDFGQKSPKIFEALISCDVEYEGKCINIRLDHRRKELLGTLHLTSTGGWSNFILQSCNVSDVTGSHKLFLEFEDGDGLFSIDSFTFR